MHRLLALPNLISAARVPLAVAFLLLPQRDARLLLIAAAAATDFLDGWLARRGRVTRFGAVLDPITDKTFLVTAVLSLAITGPLSALDVAILLSRDIAVGIGIIIVLLRRAPMKYSARMPGKVLTVLQLAALVTLVIQPGLRVPVVAVVGIASVAAIWDYGREAVLALRAPARTH